MNNYTFQLQVPMKIPNILTSKNILFFTSITKRT